MSTRTTLPTQFAAGTTVVVRVAGPLTADDGTSVSVADGFALLWVLRGTETADVVGVPDGESWVLTLTASQSSALVAGTYRSALLATKGSGASLERYPIGGVQTCEVTPDLVDALAGELEDPDDRALRLLYALRDGTLEQGFQTVMIDGKQLMHYSLDQIERAIARYELKKARKAGGPISGHIGVTFVRR